MMKSLKLISLLSVTALAGCLSVLPEPDPANSIYRLTSQAEKVDVNSTAPIIRVDTPSASRLISTRKIIVSPDAQRMAVAGGAEWADSLPNMVQTTLVKIMSSRSDMLGVMPVAGAKSKYRVHLNIDNFEARFDNGSDSAPLVIVTYTATFADTSSRNLLGTKQVKETRRASSNNVSAIVRAMDGANQSALEKLVGWIAGLGIRT